MRYLAVKLLKQSVLAQVIYVTTTILILPLRSDWLFDMSVNTLPAPSCHQTHTPTHVTTGNQTVIGVGKVLRGFQASTVNVHELSLLIILPNWFINRRREVWKWHLQRALGQILYA